MRWTFPTCVRGCATCSIQVPRRPATGGTLVFVFAFPLGNGLFGRGLPPKRATAFDILKLAGSSSHLIGPLPRRRFPRTISFERCFMRLFDCPVVCISIFVKPHIIPPGGSGSRHLVLLLIDDDL